MAKRRIDFKEGDCYDIPVISFCGSALGFFIVGFFELTLGALFEAGKEELFSLKSMISGGICIAISMAIMAIAYLYWILIPKRLGAVEPALNGFGLIIALMTLFSGAMLGAEVVFLFR